MGGDGCKNGNTVNLSWLNRVLEGSEESNDPLSRFKV